MGDPVEEASEDGDVATHGKPQGDGWVEVTTGDVGCHGHSNKQRECMGDGNGHQAGGV